MRTLTISRKIALGFTALILITGVLGGLAVSGMKTVQASTRILATEFVPEVDMGGNLQGHVAAATLAIRSYGFTGDVTYLSEAHKQLVLVHDDLAIAQKLAAEHPNLVRLREDLGPIASTLKVYEQAVADTESRNNEIAANRVKLDAAAAGFIASIDRLIEAQKGKLQGEIKAGTEPARLLERTTKLANAQDIRGLGTAVFIGIFKAQALRNSDLFSEALKSFPALEAKLIQLQGLLTVKADLDQLAQAKTDSVAYRDAAQTVMQNSISLVEIGQQRFAAATQLLTLADDIQNTGMKRTIEAADSSDRRLTVSSSTILIGIGSALLLGFGIAFFIIRGTTKVLTNVADSMSDSSSQVTAAATQVAAASQTLAEGASEQAASLEETSASLEEMSSMTKRNAESAQRAKELSGLTRHSADTGATHMSEMRQAMDAIKASSDDIAKIIKTIDEIAFQTNILALNAAVEAARAGEAGMGFAVVAEEVRSLAQRSAQSAKETAGKIEDAIRKSEHGVIISAKVAGSLADIVDKARQMDSLVAEIATASAEQNQGIGQLNSAVSQMDKVTQSNASGAEESAAAAEELNAQALSMQQSVADLRRLVTHDPVDSSSSPESAHAAPGRAAAAPMRRPNLTDRHHASTSNQLESAAREDESFANT